MLLIKEAKFLIGMQLAKTFIECLTKVGSCPDILKIAKVVPLHKGGSKLDLNNYRHISIFSPINKLFEKKLEHYEVRGKAHDLLHSYLTIRLQFTMNNNELVSSRLLPITIGVPWGSVSGPFLFLVCINGSSKFLQF